MCIRDRYQIIKLINDAYLSSSEYGKLIIIHCKNISAVYIPVSYTHLDVYKRQAPTPYYKAGEGLIKHDYDKVLKKKITDKSIPIRDTYSREQESVSYTHLDVYKRQV